MLRALSHFFDRYSGHSANAAKGQDVLYSRDIQPDHPLRDPVLGFIDSRQAARDLVASVKEDGETGFVIAIDAQNLGQLNKLTDRKTADLIWNAHCATYVEAIRDALPFAHRICAFKDTGDEAQIIVSGKGVSERNIHKALMQAQKKTAQLFENSGLDELPSKDGIRPAGFALHHAVMPLSLEATPLDMEAMHPMERSMITERMRDAYDAPEIAMVMTRLNQDKKQNPSGQGQMTEQGFVEAYAALLSERARKTGLSFPLFRLTEDDIERLPSVSDQKMDQEKHCAFIAQARENTTVIRFDLRGMRLLNKTLDAIQVEGIIGRVKDVIDQHFRVAGSTHDFEFASFDAGGGIVDVMLDSDEWEGQRDKSLDHIRYLLNSLYELYIMQNGHHTWDKLGAAYYNANEEERKAMLLERLGDKERQLFEDLEREFNVVETRADPSEPEATLKYLSEKMLNLKDSQTTHEPAQDKPQYKPSAQLRAKGLSQ